MCVRRKEERYSSSAFYNRKVGTSTRKKSTFVTFLTLDTLVVELLVPGTRTVIKSDEHLSGTVGLWIAMTLCYTGLQKQPIL